MKVLIEQFTYPQCKNISAVIDRMTEPEREETWKEHLEFYRENPEDMGVIFQLCNGVAKSHDLCDILGIDSRNWLNPSSQKKIELAAYLFYRDYINWHK